MTDIVNPEYAVERLKILAEGISEIAGWLKEHRPDEYGSRESLGILEHAACVFLETEKR